MICFAGRRLAVLATPPHNCGAEGGTRTRALDAGNVGSWPLDDFRLERAARVELASSAWKAEAPAAIPCSPFTLWQGWQDSNLLELVLETSALPIGSSPLWRSKRELNPSLLIDSQASLPPDSATTFQNWLRGHDSNVHEPGQSRLSWPFG